jgi:hypothetical protein
VDADIAVKGGFMSNPVVRISLAAVLAVCSWGSRVDAQGVITHPYPGITYITRTESLPSFQCPGCPARVTATTKDLADNVRTLTTQCGVSHDRGKN